MTRRPRSRASMLSSSSRSASRRCRASIRWWPEALAITFRHAASASGQRLARSAPSAASTSGLSAGAAGSAAAAAGASAPARAGVVAQSAQIRPRQATDGRLPGMLDDMADLRIAIISTGGTIEKTYDELDQVLANRVNVLDVMLAQLELGNVELVRVPLMNKDSREMTEADHQLIAETARAMAASHDGVIIVHGTDRLAVTGEVTHALVPEPRVPIVLTGAMRPYELRHTDATQNLTEALLAAQLLPGGVYAALHNRVHRFPGVTKDTSAGCFVGGEVRLSRPAG